MYKSNPVNIKAFGIFVFILLTGVIVTVVMLNTTDSSGNRQDIRSHAQNPADSVVDSDALLNASEQTFNTVQNDPELNSENDPDEDAEVAEINAL